MGVGPDLMELFAVEDSVGIEKLVSHDEAESSSSCVMPCFTASIKMGARRPLKSIPTLAKEFAQYVSWVSREVSREGSEIKGSVS